MKKISETKNTTSKSIRPKKLKANPKGFDFKKDPFFFFKFQHISDNKLEEVTDLLVEWMERNQGNTVLAKFFAEYNIPDQRFYAWLQQPRGKRLSHAFALYKQRLAVTREQGINLNQLNFKAISFNQHQYSPKWKEANEYHNELKQQIAEKESSGKQIVLMKEYKLDDTVIEE